MFSVSISDCEIQTFTCGGKGGSGKDTSNNGVRIIHHPSGARGECREQRHQLANKRIAFTRMGESKAFKVWAKLQVSKINKTYVDAEKWANEQLKFEVGI